MIMKSILLFLLLIFPMSINAQIQKGSHYLDDLFSKVTIFICDDVCGDSKMVYSSDNRVSFRC